MGNNKDTRLLTILSWIILVLLISAILGVCIYFFVIKENETNTYNEKNELHWGYKCENRKCVRVLASDVDFIMGISSCFLMCIPFGTLWPKPRIEALSIRRLVNVDRNKISYNWQADDASDSKLIKPCMVRFFDRLDKKILQNGTNGNVLQIIVKTANLSSNFDLDTDESYSLKIYEEEGKTMAEISATNYFGVRHALETLLNLMVVDEVTNNLMIPDNATIFDKPVYKHRGLLIDTVHNYISPSTLKRTIDTMAAVKLNVLHWYIIGPQSFPVALKSNLELSKLGSYSKNQVYDSEIIKDLVNYAKIRGIRIIPEFESPAKIGEGWHDPKIRICVKDWPLHFMEPPFGQFDITNKNLVPKLDSIFQELIDAFQAPEYFHIGGRGVSLECWNSSQPIREFLNCINSNCSENMFLKLWATYLHKVVNIINSHSRSTKRIFAWHETVQRNPFTMPELTPYKSVLQILRNNETEEIHDVLNKGYDIVYSDNMALNFDSLYDTSSVNGKCILKTWKDVYFTNVEDILRYNSSKILGVEGLLWTKFTDDKTLDFKLWPKASALAERLWANPQSGYENLNSRMFYHRKQLITNGILADTIMSEWCFNNLNECDL